MQLVGDLPLSSLGGLLSYAEEQELQPLWIANFFISKITNKEPVSYGDFMNAVFNDKTPQTKKKSSPADIEAEFDVIVNDDRAKLQKGGISRG